MGLSTEILYDETVSLTEARQSLDSLEYVQQFAHSIEIDPQPKRIFMPQVGLRHINIAKDFEIFSEANLSMILTKKMLVTGSEVMRGRVKQSFKKSDTRYAGFGWQVQKEVHRGAAIIDLVNATNLETVMAHETGHMLGINPESHTTRDKLHCKIGNCVMAKILKNDVDYEFCNGCATDMYTLSSKLSNTVMQSYS